MDVESGCGIICRITVPMPATASTILSHSNASLYNIDCTNFFARDRLQGATIMLSICIEIAPLDHLE